MPEGLQEFPPWPAFPLAEEEIPLFEKEGAGEI
jgi:hypothetical protein